jgi:RNA polymerase sigma-70 factor (ECF subfamily)
MSADETTEVHWRAFADPLRRFLRSRVGDRDVAEDLLQEVFLRLHQRREPIGEIERIDAWLFRVAGNVAIDHLRRRGTAGLDDHGEPSEAPVLSDDEQPGRVLAAWIVGRVAALPDKYRDVLELTEQRGLSQRAVAEQLGLPYSTVKSRVQRGRDLLHADLLRCCEVELDARNRIMDFRPRAEPCACGDGPRSCAGEPKPE